MHADPALIRSVKAHVSPEEWAVRTDLAAAYRAVAMHGWDDLVFTHISARIPGPGHHFLINPYGMMFEEITASSLVKIDLAGNKVMDSPFEINPAGFTIHSAVHEARADAHCVMHLHTTATQAVCCLKEGLSFTNFYAAQLYGKVAYHDFEGITVHADEGERILRSAEGRPVLLLRNHGPVTIGHTLPQALLLMWTVNRACEVQLAMQGKGEAIPISREVLEKCVVDALQFNPKYGAGQDSFAALQRLIDRKDPGYRM